MQNLLRIGYEKILLLSNATSRGDYHRKRSGDTIALACDNLNRLLERSYLVPGPPPQTPAGVLGAASGEVLSK